MKNNENNSANNNQECRTDKMIPWLPSRRHKDVSIEAGIEANNAIERIINISRFLRSKRGS